MSQRFVVHEHNATRLHYDFRLEMEGVLRSWAIPKGPSMDPSQRRLAMLVDDHALPYINFEGIIPEGRYGAGEVVIWDKGSYDPIELNKDRLVFFLKGEKLNGNFTLVRFKGKGNENKWLLIKRKDEYAQSGWKLETALTSEKLAQLKKRNPMYETS